MSRRAAAIGLACALAACRGGGPPAAATTAAAAPTPAVVEPVDATLDEIAILARGVELTAAERLALRGADREAARRFVDSMIATDPRVAANGPLVLVPNALFPNVLTGTFVEVFGELKTFPGRGGRPIYYADEPCKVAEAVEVTPWWDMASRVSICRDDYKPELLRDSVGTACRPEFDDCGCGAFLMSCAPAGEIVAALRTSLGNEVRDTALHLLARDARIAELFTSNATFRDRRAELWYRRARVVNGEPAAQVFRDYAAWPEQGTWAPRPEIVEGQESGILTTDHMLWLVPGPRERLQLYQELMWCIDARSVKVTSDEIFGLGTAEFRNQGGGGLVLATKPVCETCHARLDNALPFFQPHEHQIFIRPPKPAVGRIYGRDSRDFRAEGPAVPGTFGRLATAAPEFGQCMSRRVVEHVLGEDASGDDHREVFAAYQASGTYRPMLKVALHRLLERRLTQRARAAATAPAAPVAAMLEEACGTCHDGPEPIDLATMPMERSTLQRALDEVSTGRMPKGFPPLGTTERVRLIDGLVAAWPDPTERAAIAATYSTTAHSLGAHRPQAIQRAIHDRAHLAGEPDVSSIPMPYASLSRRNLEMTPDLVTFAAAAVVRACKSDDAAAWRACIERTGRGLLVRP